MSKISNYESAWNETMSRIKKDIGDQAFNWWFNLSYSGFDEGKITVMAPSAFHRDSIVQRYSKLIETTLADVAGEKLTIFIKVDDSAPAIPDAPAPKRESAPQNSAKVSVKADSGPEKKDANPLLNKEFTFENYVRGDNNEFAVNAALAVSKNPGGAYNPLFIYSGVGLGKTHLMQAIGNFIHQNSDSSKIIYTTAESFLNDFTDAIKDNVGPGSTKNSMTAFRNKYRKADLLLIDDIYILEKKDGLQNELFNIFNELSNKKKQMVFTCDRPVQELKSVAERLTSRLGSGLSVDIQMPQYEVKCAILRKKAEEKNISIPNEVIELISKNISTNVRDLVGAFTKLIGYADLLKKPVTLSIAQDQLRDMFASPKQSNLSMENIQQVIANHFSVSIPDLKCKKRTKTLVRPRQISMYIIKNLTEYTTTDIGQAFGGRDHTTVIHAINTVEERIKSDPSEDRLIQSLIRTVKEFSVK